MKEQIKTLKIEKNKENPTEYLLIANKIPYFKGYGLSKTDVEKQVLLEYYNEGFVGGSNKYKKLVDSVKNTNNVINRGYEEIYKKFVRATKRLYKLQKEYRKNYGKCLTQKANYKNYNYVAKKAKGLLNMSETFLKETLYLALK